MSEYIAIRKQIAELEKKASALFENAKQEAISKVNELIQEYSLTPNDIQFPTYDNPKRKSKKLEKTTRSPVAIKYKSKNNESWTGRGKQPKWVRDAIESGISLDSLRVR